MSISTMSPAFTKPMGPPTCRFGADMADAGAAGAAAESAVGDQGDGFAEAGTHDVAGRG